MYSFLGNFWVENHQQSEDLQIFKFTNCSCMLRSWPGSWFEPMLKISSCYDVSSTSDNNIYLEIEIWPMKITLTCV